MERLCLLLQDANISQFNESISVCERLIRTPIPLAYTRLTSRILVLWHLALPVVLWDDCHWVVVPATFISAASLFCIEEVRYISISQMMQHIICPLFRITKMS